MKKILFLTVIVILFSSCNGGKSNDENVKISKEFISAISNESSETLMNILPIMDEPESMFSRFINRIKQKFINQGLKGWKTIEAKGYIFGGNGIDIIVIDANGSYFTFHELKFSKNGEKIFYRIGNDDIHKFKTKDDIIKDIEDRGGSSKDIHWF